MQPTTPSPASAPASSSTIRLIALYLMMGNVLTLGGCVSSQTYESARQEATQRANELAQVQADIQRLEQERDATHAANQRDERALGKLKSELHNIHVSPDQIRKNNQAKLVALQQNIAALRARHQAMLKEISETKRYEKKLEALTAERDRVMAVTPAGPDAHVTTVDGLQHEPRMVAVITPSSSPSEESPATPTRALRDVPIGTSMHSSPATSTSPSTIVPVSTPPDIPGKTAPVTTATPAHASMPAAPQHGSWFSSMTEWLTSMFDWLWS